MRDVRSHGRIYSRKVGHAIGIWILKLTNFCLALAETKWPSFTVPVQLEFILNPFRRSSKDELLEVNGRQIPLALHRNLRARRYVLRLRPNGLARVTIPRGGSIKEALRFVDRNKDWLERQLHKLATQPNRPTEWTIGTELLFRGEPLKIEAGVNGESGRIKLGAEVIKVANLTANLRPAVEKHLWRLAAKELPPRVMEHAALHSAPVRRVTVRNQRSRWGSCSRNGTISLNWRLIQAPSYVCNYLILHELSHLKHMNHSARFWREVERVCPDYRIAERWLKQHSALLRD